MLNRMGRKEFENDRTGYGAACADWGALLPDAAEDLLSEAEAQALALHIARCPACEAELAEARRGAAWLALLKSDVPEPSRDLVAGILARTTGIPTLGEAVAAELVPEPVPAWAVTAPQAGSALGSAQLGLEPGPLRRRIARWFGLDTQAVPVPGTRFTMTAAMAFFSVCLTLNLLGISVTQLHAQDLHGVHLQRTVAGEEASLLRSLEGIRIVYRVESRVGDWLAASLMPSMATRQ